MRVERHDIYSSLRLEGVVERRPGVPVTVSTGGHFTPIAGLRAGQTMQPADRLGLLRTCRPSPTAAEPAAVRCSGRPIVVLARAAGLLVRLPVEADLRPGDPVSEIQPAGFRAHLSVGDVSVLYAFTSPPRTGRGEVVGGPSGFTVTYESLHYDRDTGRVDVYAGLPLTLRLFEGLRVVAVFVVGRSSGVPTLPRSAVRGQQQTGEVVVLELDGRRTVRQIRLGASDLTRLEVIGLPPDADVILFPLESDFGR